MANGPITKSLQQALGTAPWALRQDLLGYTNAVASVMHEIAHDGGIRLTPELADQFLAMATIRRLWHVVEGQYWLMHDSLDLLSMRSSGAAGYRIGRTTVSLSSDAYGDARGLLDDLKGWLEARDLWDLVGTPDLVGLLGELAGDHGARH